MVQVTDFICAVSLGRTYEVMLVPTSSLWAHLPFVSMLHPSFRQGISAESVSQSFAIISDLPSWFCEMGMEEVNFAPVL